LSIMAASRPVIASLPQESDARRILAEAGAGVCVPAGDAEALAAAIRQLHAQPSLARDMGRRGRTYVEAHFSRQACIDQLEAVLLDSARRNGGNS